MDNRLNSDSITESSAVALTKKAKTMDETSSNGKAPLLKAIYDYDLSRVAIFSGAGVDPDGLASQATMAAIIKKHDENSEITCFYRGSFDRPQNKTMRQALGLNVTSQDKFDDLHAETPFTCIISVDGPANVCSALPHFIIDHHAQKDPATVGNDVRPIGSASAIVWEYAMAAELDFESEEGQRLATALAIGILTDTVVGATPNSSDLDFEALAYCLQHKDNKLYNEIQNYPKPGYYNDMYVEGWKNKYQDGTVLVTGLGVVHRARSGVLSYLAEEYASTEGVHTSVVCAIIDGNIEISIRSSNSAINVDEFVKNTFGSGGGKRGAGKAVIKMPHLLTNLRETHAEKLWEAVREIIIAKTIEAAGDGAQMDAPVNGA